MWFDELAVATSYRIAGATREEVQDYPAQLADLSRVEPCYDTRPGWSEDISSVRRYEDLPRAARDYVEYLEEKIGRPAVMLSVGPARDQVIRRMSLLP